MLFPFLMNALSSPLQELDSRTTTFFLLPLSLSNTLISQAFHDFLPFTVPSRSPDAGDASRGWAL